MLLANVQAGESSILVWDDGNNVVIVAIGAFSDTRNSVSMPVNSINSCILVESFGKV